MPFNNNSEKKKLNVQENVMPLNKIFLKCFKCANNAMPYWNVLNMQMNAMPYWNVLNVQENAMPCNKISI